MSHLIAAPDKFRGTATAAEVAAAVGGAARRAGWTADEIPMSDGGEGLLLAVGGTPRRTWVPGPLGVSTEAEWRLLAAGPDGGPTAVIEMSRAAGRSLLPDPRGDDPVAADTAGVGHLVLRAREAGATRIVIGCGGSATTDGGWGAVEVVGTPANLAGVDLDGGVRRDHALRRRRRGVRSAEGGVARAGRTVDRPPALPGRSLPAGLRGRRRRHPRRGGGRGAGRGARRPGARLVPGFDLVAAMTGLADRLHLADLVVTGEGHLDPPSFAGKVPGGVLRLVAGRCPVLGIVGDADQALLRSPPAGLEIISLADRFGAARARLETAALVAEVTEDVLRRPCP